MKRAFKL